MQLKPMKLKKIDFATVLVDPHGADVQWKTRTFLEV